MRDLWRKAVPRRVGLGLGAAGALGAVGYGAGAAGNAVIRGVSALKDRMTQPALPKLDPHLFAKAMTLLNQKA